jgi:hypothetical protein
MRIQRTFLQRCVAFAVFVVYVEFERRQMLQAPSKSLIVLRGKSLSIVLPLAAEDFVEFSQAMMENIAPIAAQ